MKETTIYSVAGAVLLTAVIGIGTSVRPAHSEETGTGGDVGRGARTWVENCLRCHNARDPREFRDDLWKPIVYHMRVRAGLTGQQTRDVLAYIQASN